MKKKFDRVREIIETLGKYGHAMPSSARKGFLITLSQLSVAVGEIAGELAKSKRSRSKKGGKKA